MTTPDRVLAVLAAVVSTVPLSAAVVLAALGAEAWARWRNARLPDWSPETGPIEGTFAEERDPELTEIERRAQAETETEEGQR